MKATCCRWPSLWTSALIPAWPSRSFKALALAGSLNVAIVTIRPEDKSKHQLTGKCKIRRRVPFIEHQVDDNPRHRDVEPDRHGPASDAAVTVPAAAKDRDQRGHDQRKSDESEQDMADQEGEINQCHRAARAEVGRLFSDV